MEVPVGCVKRTGVLISQKDRCVSRTLQDRTMPTTTLVSLAAALAFAQTPARPGPSGTRVYENTLSPIKDPRPILADHPEYVEPVRETARFEAPVLVDDPGADLDVRAWRFSYNARGILEVPNRLRL